MIHTVVITQVKDELHIIHNGGLAHRFDTEIFSVGQVFRFAQKQYEPFAKKGHLVDISLDKGMEYAVCKKCGSTDVEIKAFINQENGIADYSSYDDEDTFCNRCDDHTGVEFKKVE